MMIDQVGVSVRACKQSRRRIEPTRGEPAGIQPIWMNRFWLHSDKGSKAECSGVNKGGAERMQGRPKERPDVPPHSSRNNAPANALHWALLRADDSNVELEVRSDKLE
jgi:hypothetical protein